MDRQKVGCDVMLSLFGFEGMVWADKAKTIPVDDGYFIRCVNKRNGKWDAESLGVEEGTFPKEGHYSLCLVDFKGNDSVRVGDEIEFYLFKKPGHEKLVDLGSIKISADNVKVAGMALNFVLEGKI